MVIHNEYNLYIRASDPEIHANREYERNNEKKLLKSFLECGWNNCYYFSEVKPNFII
jgi:hypothetical protein